MKSEEEEEEVGQNEIERGMRRREAMSGQKEEGDTDGERERDECVGQYVLSPSRKL